MPNNGKAIKNLKETETVGLKFLNEKKRGKNFHLFSSGFEFTMLAISLVSLLELETFCFFLVFNLKISSRFIFKDLFRF